MSHALVTAPDEGALRRWLDARADAAVAQLVKVFLVDDDGNVTRYEPGEPW